MRTDHWIITASLALKKSGVPTAHLDAMVLLGDATNQDKGWLLAHPESLLSPKQLAELQKSLQRRSNHEPLAYIRGKSEFFGHEFAVDKRVMEPRPETEDMVELLVEQCQQLEETALIVDVGTGSGALAISAKLALPQADVYALDVSADCLAVAQDNATRLRADIRLIESDLLARWNKNKTAITAILANLPYVPNDYPLNKAATYEPRLAIFGGTDGLDVYRRLFDQIEGLSRPPRLVLCESLELSHQALTLVAGVAGYRLETTRGLVQLFGRIEA